MAGLDPTLLRQLGAHIRRARQHRDLTLAALAERVGLSASALSQLERGLLEPSVSTLWRLSEALGASLFHFFTEQQETPVSILRGSGNRMKLDFSSFRYEVLTLASRRQLDFFILRLPPRGVPAREALAHRGEECGLVLEGALDVSIAGETYRLEKGDSIWFLSTQPHTFSAVGPEECVSVWAMTPPDTQLFGVQPD